MRIEFILSSIFFIVGALGIVKALMDKDPWLLGLGTLLWWGCLFFEILIIKQDVKGGNSE